MKGTIPGQKVFTSGAGVGGSRNVNTVYQNTGSNPRLVMFGATDAANICIAYIGSSDPPTSLCGLIPNSLASIGMTFCVPAGWYYKVETAGTTVTMWHEVN